MESNPTFTGAWRLPACEWNSLAELTKLPSEYLSKEASEMQSSIEEKCEIPSYIPAATSVIRL